MKAMNVLLVLTCALLASSPGSWVDSAQADGDVPANDTHNEQAPPADAAMSHDACLALIKQSDELWQNYSTWSKYRGDRTAHGFRDGIFHATENLKHFSRGLHKEERDDINDFLAGRAGTVMSITRGLNEANTRLAVLAAVVARGGAPETEESNLADHFRVHFKITDNPRSIKMIAGGRPRFDFDYVEMKEREKKYVPLTIELGFSDKEHPEAEVLSEQLAIDTASEAAIKMNTALTTPDAPHYVASKDFMIGQKIVPAKCFEIPKVVVKAPSVNERPDSPGRDWERYWNRWDRPEHFNSSHSGRGGM